MWNVVYKPRTSILVTVVTLSIAMIRMCHKIFICSQLLLECLYVCEKSASQEALLWDFLLLLRMISDQGYHRLVATQNTVRNESRFDEDCANVLLWLIQERLLTEDDVKDMYLMNLLILNEPQPPKWDSKPNYFAERWFQVLVNHFPNCLVGSP